MATVGRCLSAFWRRQRGFTLVEIMSVMTILSLLSAITLPAISGTSSFARATTQGLDISGMQQAIDRFANETDRVYPTLSALPGTPSGWTAGSLPWSAPTGGSGFVITQPIVFVPESIAGIDFGARHSLSVTPRLFVGSYIRALPEYYDKTHAVPPGADSEVFRIKKLGHNYYAKLRNTTTSTMYFHKWGLDKNGDVWVFVDQDSY